VTVEPSVSVVKAVGSGAALTVQAVPSVQACPFTVKDGLASAELGMELTATPSAGVLAALATVGVIHDGQADVEAWKLVTVPVPTPVPQSFNVPAASAKQAASLAVVPALGPVVNPAPAPATLASAEVGIGPADTVKVGAVVALATVGTIHDGQADVEAWKLVTVPVPTPVPQSFNVPAASAKQAASLVVVPLFGPVVNPAPAPATLASAEVGIGPADTDKLGVVVALETIGTIHEGQLAEDAPKLVTVPVPLPAVAPQSFNVPNASAKQGTSFATVLVGPVVSPAPDPVGAAPLIRVCGVPPPHSATCPAVGDPETTGTFPPLEALSENEPPLNNHALVEGL
jgi:hypothetical protein